MAANQVEEIVHPVRLRILLDIAGRERTPQEVQRALPDVSQASLYRHIARLTRAGILKVVRETPVRGATEKVYALADASAGDIDRTAWGEISREDHLRYFTGFLSALLGQFRLYSQQENFDMNADRTGYATEPMNVTPEEHDALRAQLRALMQNAADNPLTPERRRILLTVIQMPAAEPDTVPSQASSGTAKTE